MPAAAELVAACIVQLHAPAFPCFVIQVKTASRAEEMQRGCKRVRSVGRVVLLGVRETGSGYRNARIRLSLALLKEA